jgi:hypothetical protein
VLTSKKAAVGGVHTVTSAAMFTSGVTHKKGRSVPPACAAVMHLHVIF